MHTPRVSNNDSQTEGDKGSGGGEEGEGKGQEGSTLPSHPVPYAFLVSTVLSCVPDTGELQAGPGVCPPATLQPLRACAGETHVLPPWFQSKGGIKKRAREATV